MESQPMKIGIFAYNFPHKKTQEGLINLLLQGYTITCIFAADPEVLPFYQSKIRIAPKGLEYVHPRDIAARFGIPYYVLIHNSPECENLIKIHQLDLGIILGARILKKNIIRAFSRGILNMHPGLLPQNRGLDNIKWAILNDYKQGVSVHFIDEKIDQGSLILQREIDVYEDDTLVDLFLRIQNTEQTALQEALRILESGKRVFQQVGEGQYFKAVPPEKEATLMEKFEEYKKKYRELKS